MKIYHLILLFLLVGCKDNSEEKKVDQSTTPGLTDQVENKIANANGLKNFDDIKQIDFTFNVKVADTIRSKRIWSWDVKNDKVRLTEGDVSRVLHRKDSIVEKNKDIDQKFINICWIVTY